MSITLKYSYSWGREVVNTFVEKYARGTYYFSRLLDIPAGELRHYFTLILCKGNSLKWQACKRVCIALSGYEREDLDRFDAGERKALYICLYNLAVNDQLDEKNMYSTLDSLNQKRLFF